MDTTPQRIFQALQVRDRGKKSLKVHFIIYSAHDRVRKSCPFMAKTLLKYVKDWELGTRQ